MTRNRQTIGGIILGAGESSRFGCENKLLATVEGIPIINRVARTVTESPIDERVAVLGHEAKAVEDALEGFPISTVYNDSYTVGQSTSVRHGIDFGRNSGWDAAIVVLGDMPFVEAGTISQLIDAYRSGDGTIIAPQYDGRRGNPVLFDHQQFSELAAVSGDRGGRRLVQTHPGTELIDTDDPGVVQDVDTAADLAMRTG